MSVVNNRVDKCGKNASRIPASVLAARLLTGLLFAYAAYGALAPYLPYVSGHGAISASKTMWVPDGDQAEHFRNLSKFPTFLSTFYYWTHDWSGGFPYWRPLTCQCFWTEMHLFGTTRFDLWSSVSVVSQLLVEVLLAWLVKILTGSWSIGALAAALFAGCSLPDSLTMPLKPFMPESLATADVTEGNWKNQPDIWMTACTLGSLIAVLNRRWAVATVVALLAPCFKENGWLAYPLIVLFLMLRGGLMQIPAWAWGVNSTFVAVWIAFRRMAHLKIANIDTIGHNLHPLTRYLNIAEGPFLGLMSRGHIAQAVIAIGATVAMLAPRINYRGRFAIVCASLLAAGMAGTVDVGQGLLVPLITALDPRGGIQATIAATVWLTGLAILLMDKDLRIIGIVMLLIRLVSAATVTLALAVGVHTIYLSNVFYCSFWAVGAFAIWKRLRRTTIYQSERCIEGT